MKLPWARYNPGVRTFLIISLAALAGCSSNSPQDSLRIQDVTLPRGQVIHAEVAITQQDLTRGLMFRNSLAADRGMLFVFPQPGLFPLFMYHYNISLDMLWLDSNRRVVEIAANVPPCRTKGADCPRYGGTQTAQYVLEIGAGMAAKQGIEKGSQLSF